MDRTCIILSSKGYGGGNPENIAQMKVNWVLKIKEYEKFKIDLKEESNGYR